MNGDRHPDLVAANHDGASFSILLGDGSGGFSGPFGFAVGRAPDSIALADFDGDSLLDVAVANRDGDDVSVRLNQCAPCQADVDGDGGVGIVDLLALLEAWGADPGGPPDLDGDGTVGPADFDMLLGDWGTCP